MSVRTLRSIFTNPLNKGARQKAYLRYVKWHVGSRLVPGDVVYQWVNGVKFIASTAESGLIGNVYSGLHDFQEMAYTCHVLRQDDLFVDIGANSGAYTLLACGVSGARCCSIEPIPSTFARLVANLRLNHFVDRVRCLNIGVGAQEDTIPFTSDQNVANHAVSSDDITAQTVNVAVMQLDTVLRNDLPSMLKMDVEGYEVAALRGASQVLKSESLHSVIIEINGLGRRYGFDDRCVIEIMKNSGFECCEYAPFSRHLSIVQDKDILRHLTMAQNKDEYCKNMLFIRNIEYVRQRIASAPTIHINDKEL